MSQWKSFANVAGMPEWSAQINDQGSGHTAKAANNASLIANSTGGAFVTAGVDPSGYSGTEPKKNAIGIYPVTSFNKANTSGESARVHALGWAQRRAYEGPIISMSVANGVFANGETVTVSGGSSNATITLGTNATGNLASYVITNGGLFPNTSNTSTAFNRELHVANLNVSGTDSNIGDANVVYLYIGNTDISYGVNAFAVLASNATGHVGNTQTQAITWSGNTAEAGNTAIANGTGFWGLFANVQANTDVAVTVLNANGSPITGLTFSANLVPSTGGNTHVTGLGGRAGRVTYETLVVDRHIANGTSSFANTVQLPQ
jgi:hypothetical protein